MKPNRMFLFLLLFVVSFGYSQNPTSRETINIDAGWRFAFGHPNDAAKDFGHAEAYFSYLAKTGSADGPAGAGFDDRAWRQLNLPHDWAVEQPFSEKASYSHGFHAAGKGFPDKSIGWYRKQINISKEDLGRIITLKFDGVFRNCKVWFNGHFLGTEESGYNSFEYDVTAYVKYGEKNTIAVRVDASMEEGWWYEGAGIYRHVYLQKTQPLHIATNGTYITTQINGANAEISVVSTLLNQGSYTGAVALRHTVYDTGNKAVATITEPVTVPGFYKTADKKSSLTISNAQLWDIEHPDLYTLVTEVLQEGKPVDRYETTFGIREIHFDAEKGLFLNGKPVKLKGTNNHQDHAGVGTAIPDELQYWRIKQLKDMGSNAYRCSHHPPTPELLDACDKLGMLVIDETRLMGINQYHLGNLKRLIERDRNHPSVFCWSVGNEEWAIEGNITGERITQVMQDFAHSIDPTRPVTVGISSGFRSGISSVVEVMGYNYLGNGDIDAHRSQFKNQPGMGTEEGSTFATRGVYVTDDARHYQSAYDRKPRPSFYSIEEGWTFYATRPYLAGMFIWTGFDYRGEPTPYGWPSVTSYFGMMDVCGFPKDNVYYLKSWWGTAPVVHLLPHWNWPGKEGKEINVWVHTNCDSVELFLNKKSLGKKSVKQFSHLEWNVIYQPGTLEAVGYKNGKMVMADVQKTTGTPAAIKLTPHKTTLKSATDVAVVTVAVLDKKGLHVPVADNLITFSIKNGTVLGVGNGDPTSLENDRFIDDVQLVPLTGLKEQALSTSVLPSVLAPYEETAWKEGFKDRDYKNLAPAYAYKTSFVLDKLEGVQVTFYYKKIGVDAVVFVNGVKVSASTDDAQKFVLDAKILKQGSNTMHIVATPEHKVHDWDVINADPGVLQVVTPAAPYTRKLFNGYAQIIVQPDGSGKPIELGATSKGVKGEKIILGIGQ
ncbi:beta-galactosidase GalA [Flavobacterium sp. RNTU_13]|uniref:beta-galactosidase GalA n=1 Tax=Flavobacterium sp. RNTU_13 TaxID=3375145 RepID=UPI00398745E1